ncbi:MAG: hypothetical protein U9Q16_02880 [Patescibacteria group bacterium]|nr:hypothetical protein [Patescibacteria group bacterium]
MAIEITPRREIKAPLWAIILLAFSLILFIALLASYFYFLQASVKLEKEIENSNVPEASSKSIEEETIKLSLYKEKINDFKVLISQHKDAEKVFGFFQETIHPDVWFNDFNFDSRGNTVGVSGRAESFVALEHQLIIFKEDEIVKSVNISDVSIDEKGGVSFSLSFAFDNQIFK